MDIERIEKASRDCSPYILKTPLERCPELEKFLETDSRIFFKREDLQVTNTFKSRGAFNALLNLTPEQKKRGVVTRSSGNFAQAVACAAERLSIPAVIVMPEDAPKIKRQLTEAYSPELIICGNSHEEGQATVESVKKERGCTVLSPYDHLDVIAGQGIIGLEVCASLPSIRHYYCAIGGGGLLGGSAAALKQHLASVRICGVEPEGARDYYLSRLARERTVFSPVDTIADGLRAPVVGTHNWPLLEKYVDDVKLVTDLEIKKAMLWLYENKQLVIEPSGAAALAAILFHKPYFEGDVVCVISGANVDREMFDKWLSEARA